MRALHEAVDRGVNFFDTADVYGDGRSERLVGKLRSERSGEKIIVATKAGRRLDPHTADGYTRNNLEKFVSRSLRNLGVDSLDLLQLHCPPTEVYYRPELFGVLDDFVSDGRIRYYGVSVEKVEEAFIAAEYPNVQSIQIIFNMFRQRPSDRLFEVAAERKIGILARVPLSSGMLTGKMGRNSKFDRDDHRSFNRNGSAFDKGETFSGIDFEVGLGAVEKLKQICPPGMTLSQFALRWILMFDPVTATIPGARNPVQIRENVVAADLPSLPPHIMKEIKEIYESHIQKHVHFRW
jgi:aryl-alcohol dehydrogenase-like predicted oxidoreductase